MTIADPLSSEDLAELLLVFPNDALRALVGILKGGSSPTEFRAPRAYATHSLTDDADFKPFAPQIAEEILWWGSNEFVRHYTGTLPDWREVITEVAASVGVPETERGTDAPVLKIEAAVLRKTLGNWEKLTPEERQELIDKAGGDFDAARGGLFAAFGLASSLGGDALLSILGPRVAGVVAAGTVIAPLAVGLGLGWTAWDLAGPSLRIIRPAALVVAFTRQRLRDERNFHGYED
jgi:uncharacterized protein YaaW (UPF0174 family)